MYLNEYQREAHKTAQYRTEIYPFLGLAEEAGEVLGKVAKALRKESYTENPMSIYEVTGEIQAELGDVLWMLSECCWVLDIPLSELAVGNLEKLRDRQLRNMIVGEGDNR